MAWSYQVYHDKSSWGQYGEYAAEDTLTISQTGTTSDVVNIRLTRSMGVTDASVANNTFTFQCSGQSVSVYIQGYSYGVTSVMSRTADTTFPKAWVGKTVTMTRSSDSKSYSFTLGAYAQFSLSITSAAKNPVTVKRTSSPQAGASTGNLSNGAAIYTGDVLQVTYTLAAGYKGQVTLNNVVISSGATHTVSANVTVVSTAEPMATLHVWNGSGWDLYLIYVFTGAAWELHQTNIYNGSSWDKYY